MNIEIIGAIDQQAHYGFADVNNLLSADVQSLAIGSDFIGRPGTQLYVGATDVIKIRRDLSLNPDQARAWLHQTLQKERQMAVHHPHKTWFLLSNATNEAIIASICPRLKPLHTELNVIADAEQRLALLTAVFRLYLTLAKNTGDKLDEGLSNFALAPTGQVYYLDDEYYAWDDFAAFSVMLGVYIRSFAWLDAQFISALADHLVALLQEIFADTDSSVSVARQLHSLFMPNQEKQQLADLFIKSLQKPRSVSPQVQPLSVISAVVAENTQTITPPRRTSARFIALLADIHANYAALSCVLDYLARHDIRQGLVLGDIVGYGPEPKECIERLQDSHFQIIKGNHDHGVASGDSGRGFSGHSKTLIDWTIQQLTPEHRAWLAALPAFIAQDDWFAVHGAPMDAEYFHAYVYVMTYQDNLDYMQDKNMRLCFHGHSHMPGIFARNKSGHDIQKTSASIELSAYKHTLVCPGSVGQPRNGHTDTQFAIYDREQACINFINLPYDYEATVNKMRDYRLPETLWQRLLNGR